MICKIFKFKACLLSLLSLVAIVVIPVLSEIEYQREARNLHNKFRARHSAKSLYSSDDLNRRASKCAQYYADMGSIDHTCHEGEDFGENIYALWSTTSPSDRRIATRATENWYAEESKYRYNGRQTGTGHFTQMVWRDSRDFGFGIGRAGNMVVGVGLYSPAGNVVGDFGSNVRQPTSYSDH